MTRYSEPEACFVVFILFGRELELQENWLYLRLCTSLKKCTKRTPSKAVCSGLNGTVKQRNCAATAGHIQLRKFFLRKLTEREKIENIAPIVDSRQNGTVHNYRRQHTVHP
ncbi:hypothetical protein OUZ56_028976 [Daphnia magna]|uniref:Uncharacterized protein n=1 Tax=Daphnia magna TaxID=35525 RepID=A0ABR0B5I9_9CRUS|nr:hypothetical protein OUZ56_028976 [Daphnia magna]